MTSTANLDRLRAAYSDVRWDEAAPLVDFQRAEQVESFRIVAADGHDINEARSIADLPAPAAPGERALAASFADASETLVFDAEHANGTAAPGDWREFGVLLVNVRAPSRPVDLNFTVTTTTVGASAWTQVLHLDPGWNALRIDLNDLGRRVDLGHVRTLTWRLLPEEGAAESAVAPATTLYFNGLVLAHRTRWIVGRDAKPGELYVFARGARIVVGSREHFELAFVGGALIAWYVGGSDNLALPSGLGPWPVVLRPGWEQAATPIDLRDLQRPGSAPHEAGQRLLEASSWRVVITNAPAPPDQDAGRVSAASEPAPPPQTWQYAIYADGRAFVQATSTLAPATSAGDRLGFAVAAAGRADFRLADVPPGDPAHPPAEFILLARTDPGPADLFWTCATPDALARRRLFQANQQDPFVAVAGDLPASQPGPTAHLLRFWPGGLDSSGAETLAADYQRPAALHVSVGRLATDVPGDLNQDGFNESEGCYELALHRDVLRFVFDPGDLTRTAPIFRIHGTNGRRCWAYVNGQALPTDNRDAAGRLMFMLPGTIDTPRAIEVHAQPAASALRD